MSLRCIFSFFLSSGMLALWRGSGDLEVVHERDDLNSMNLLTLYLKRHCMQCIKNICNTINVPD